MRVQALKDAKAKFDEHAKRNGDVQTEWRSSTSDAVTAVSLHARYADLVIVGQAHGDDGANVDPDFPERLLLSAGRPLLIVPYAGDFENAGERALICWSATRESTRAVNDALPLLKKATAVHVATFNPRRSAHGEVPGADIGLFLARHGVKVEVSEYQAPDLDVGSQILSRAMDLGSDLIVMGGYGHSRVHELILGGVSRTLLESMTVPVLISH
jgi:nucleotide-binding universal stress UspA family protein